MFTLVIGGEGRGRKGGRTPPPPTSNRKKKQILKNVCVGVCRSVDAK